jgi:hypothetical protein
MRIGSLSLVTGGLYDIDGNLVRLKCCMTNSWSSRTGHRHPKSSEVHLEFDALSFDGDKDRPVPLWII